MNEPTGCKFSEPYTEYHGHFNCRSINFMNMIFCNPYHNNPCKTVNKQDMICTSWANCMKGVVYICYILSEVKCKFLKTRQIWMLNILFWLLQNINLLVLILSTTKYQFATKNSSKVFGYEFNKTVRLTQNHYWRFQPILGWNSVSVAKNYSSTMLDDIRYFLYHMI